MKNGKVLYVMRNTPIDRDKPACDALLDMCLSHTPVLIFNASRKMDSMGASCSMLNRVLEANDSTPAKLLRGKEK